MVFRNMSDDEYVAIQKLTHPLTGATVYMPEGQELPDTKAMLERDGLISCKYNEHGKFVSALVHDPRRIRVFVLAIDGQCGRPTPRSRACLYRPAGRPDRPRRAVARTAPTEINGCARNAERNAYTAFAKSKAHAAKEGNRITTTQDISASNCLQPHPNGCSIRFCSNRARARLVGSRQTCVRRHQ